MALAPKQGENRNDSQGQDQSETTQTLKFSSNLLTPMLGKLMFNLNAVYIVSLQL